MNPDRRQPTRGVRGQKVFLAAVVLFSGLMLGYLLLFFDGGSDGNAEAATSRLRLEDIPFNGARAYEYLGQLCRLGPRRSGSPAMEVQRKLLEEHFRKLGGQVRLQKFSYTHPLDGTPVPLANIIVQWHPERKERILLCTHYDTLPFPLLDRDDPRGTFIGANDGGSGVALLMELAHEIPKLRCKYGIDFVLFDAEEFIFWRYGGRFFVGSEWFARDYRRNPPPYRYRWGVLLDMIGDADLQIYQERNSMWWRDTRPLVLDIWATARRLGVREFVPRKKHEVRDDHLPLHNIARIPTCNIIDFDYPAWHTQADTLDQCSALSLAKVGWVVREWLEAVD
jgi:hypothetical protein